MGIAASKFYSSNNTDAQTLFIRIVPSDEQFDEQQTRWNLLADYLLLELAAKTGYPTSSWLQGSYKFGTQIRPVKAGEEFDIDLGVYFDWAGEPDSGKFAPAQLKNFVQDALKKYAEDNADDVIEVTPPKVRCNRIRFKGDFHIDIPSYHTDSVANERSLATQQNRWEESDPKALYLWFRDLLDQTVRAKARRHICYIKIWASLAFNQDGGRPSSVLLTVLVAEAIKSLNSDEIRSDDDGFKAIIDKIITRLVNNREVANPVNQDEILSDRLTEPEFDEFLDGLISLQAICTRAVNAADLVTACDIWAEAFEHFFPAPDESEIKETAALTKALVPIAFEPQIKVVARSKANHAHRWEGMNSIGPIPKDCEIFFTLMNANSLPMGSEVHWRVRNEGGEAEYVNDLGHRVSMGDVHEERSAYNGTHYMDCAVKLGGRVIGYRRVPVTISGPPIPRRNPIARPAYVRLRGKR